MSRQSGVRERNDLLFRLRRLAPRPIGSRKFIPEVKLPLLTETGIVVSAVATYYWVLAANVGGTIARSHRRRIRSHSQNLMVSSDSGAHSSMRS